MANVDKTYATSIRGLLRIGIILCQFAGMVAAAAIFKNLYLGNYYGFAFSSVRDAYLFFSIVGLIISIAIFVIHFFKIVQKITFNFNYFIIGTDVLWCIAMIIISSFCALRESQLRPYNGYYAAYNNGSFGAAAAFGFLSAILYAIDGFIHFQNKDTKA